MIRSWVTVSFGLLALTACETKTPAGAGHAGGGPIDGAPSAAAQTAPATSDDVILIGEVGSLTGAQATFGINTHRGIELAVKEVNAAGGVKGKKLMVRVYDDQGRPEEAANAVTRLITQDKVKVVLGEVASTNSLAMAPKAQAAKVPMITPSSTNPKVTEVGDYIFRVCFIDPFQGFVMAKFARENLKLQKVAILKDQNSDYSIGLSDIFAKNFVDMGGEVISIESYNQGDTDFRPQLTAIKGKAPEALYVPGYYTDVGLIARQARQLGLRSPLLGGDGWDSEKLFELGGAAMDNSYYSNHYSSDDPSPRLQKFLADYKAAYGAKPDSSAALGYDAARVAIDALERAADVSGEAVRAALAETKDFPGVAGTITLDANRNPVKSAVVLQITEGKSKYLATVSP